MRELEEKTRKALADVMELRSSQQREMEIQELKSIHTKIEGKTNTEIIV